MTKVYLGLGSNLNNKKENLETAITLLEQRTGKLISRSSVIETAPWGYTSQNTFLNGVVLIETDLDPMELLDLVKTIELEMGRTQIKIKGVAEYQDRIIDIDILLFGNLIMETPSLKIPHPMMHKRKFVLELLGEIAPGVIHPVMRKTVSDLLLAL